MKPLFPHKTKLLKMISVHVCTLFMNVYIRQTHLYICFSMTCNYCVEMLHDMSVKPSYIHILQIVFKL